MEEENKIIIKFNYKEQEEQYSCKEENFLNAPLIQFATSKNKKIEDFTFYFGDSELKYENNILIKDSLFGKQEGKIFNIFVKDKKQEDKEEKEKEKEKKEDNYTNKNQKEEKNEIKEEKEENEKIEENPVLIDIFEEKKKIEYYDDIVCPICNTTAIIDKNDKDDLSLNILNCNNFHFLKILNLIFIINITKILIRT